MRTLQRRSQIWFHISVTRILHVWRNKSDDETPGLLCEVGDSTSFGPELGRGNLGRSGESQCLQSACVRAQMNNMPTATYSPWSWSA
jgi:hypothetical protein